MGETGAPVTSREELRAHLWDACEIEQQLMIQYLFAAFTLKKHPDASCTPAQWEYVRRWGSQVFMVARQEMEHLALANGILTAIAEDPFFARENIPVQPRYFLGRERARDHSPRTLAEGKKRGRNEHIPCDIPFLFERFNLETIGRFVCAESPFYEDLIKSGERVADWCFGSAKHPCRATSLADWTGEGGALRAAAPVEGGAGGGGLRLSRTHLPPRPLRAPGRGRAAKEQAEAFHPGSIQELYNRIRQGLHTIPNLFVGNPNQQVQVLVEYQINVSPITSVQSADLAIDLIVEEGEGIDAPPGYQSHYTRFFEVRDELVRLKKEHPAFDPALPVVTNPGPDNVTLPYTVRVMNLFNYSYTTLLYVLTSLYRNYNSQESSYPFLSTALQNVAFGPFMTMVLRPVAEVLVHLKAEKGGRETAGPSFYLEPEDERRLWPRGASTVQLPGELVPGRQAAQAAELADIDFFLDRMAWMKAEVEALSTERRLKDHLHDPAHEAWARRQLAFVHQNVTATANNLRRIYQVGEIAPFVIQY